MQYLCVTPTYAQDVFGALQIYAVSSGSAIGSCNWIIQSTFEKVLVWILVLPSRRLPLIFWAFGSFYAEKQTSNTGTGLSVGCRMRIPFFKYSLDLRNWVILHLLLKKHAQKTKQMNKNKQIVSFMALSVGCITQTILSNICLVCILELSDFHYLLLKKQQQKNDLAQLYIIVSICLHMTIYRSVSFKFGLPAVQICSAVECCYKYFLKNWHFQT